MLEKFKEIPFENSDFQILAFVIASNHTPARAYRALGLNLTSKMQSLEEALFSKREVEISLRETEVAIEGSDGFTKERLELKRDRLICSLKNMGKPIADTQHAIDFMSGLLEKIPSFTREEFEAEEPEHFTQKLALQIDSAKYGAASGSWESLINMKEVPNIGKLESFLIGIE